MKFCCYFADPQVGSNLLIEMSAYDQLKHLPFTAVSVDTAHAVYSLDGFSYEPHCPARWQRQRVQQLFIAPAFMAVTEVGTSACPLMKNIGSEISRSRSSRWTSSRCHVPGIRPVGGSQLDYAVLERKTPTHQSKVRT